MLTDAYAKDAQLGQRMRAHATLALRFALKRFESSVGRATAYLSDDGREKSCKVYVEVGPDSVIVERATHAYAHVAIERAAERARIAVARELGFELLPGLDLGSGVRLSEVVTTLARQLRRRPGPARRRSEEWHRRRRSA